MPRNYGKDTPIEVTIIEGGKMKITKKQLRRIIKEALQAKTLPEGWVMQIHAGDSSSAEGHSLLVVLKDGNGRTIGKVGADRHWTDSRCIADVFEVTGSEVSGGYGPTLYDIAIEWASLNGLGLVADRNSVSIDAERVWEKYFSSRPDVTAHKLPDGYCEGQESRAGAGDFYYYRYTKEESLIPAMARSGQLEVIFDNEVEDINFYM